MQARPLQCRGRPDGPLSVRFNRLRHRDWTWPRRLIGVVRRAPEVRQLVDGSRFTIHKCYFTVERLLEELGGSCVASRRPLNLVQLL